MIEPTGGLIHMTAHLVRTDAALGLIRAGVVIAAVCLFLALCAALSRLSEHRWRWVAAFAALALVGAGMTVSGARKPMQKQIYCCASGPISLEQVAARYDIIEVDGAFIVIAEK